LEAVQDAMMACEQAHRKELGFWKDSCEKATATATNFQREKDMYKMRYEQLLNLYLRLGYQIPNDLT
jgi:hypothetical protein